MLSFPVKQWALIMKDYCGISDAFHRKFSELFNQIAPLPYKVMCTQRKKFKYHHNFASKNPRMSSSMWKKLQKTVKIVFPYS